MDRYLGAFGVREAESHPCGSLNYFYGAFLPVILIYLVHSSYFACLRILTCVYMHLLAKKDFTEKVSR